MGKKFSAFIFLVLGINLGIVVSFLTNSFIIFLKEYGVSNSYIGILYSIRILTIVKFLWIPLIKKINISFLKKRIGETQSLIIINQAFFGILIVLLSFLNPYNNKLIVFVVLIFLIIFILNQTILISPLRIVFFSKKEQNFGVFLERIGSKIGTIITGALLLLFVEYLCIKLQLCYQKKWIIAYSSLALFSFIITCSCLLLENKVGNVIQKEEVSTLYIQYFKKIKDFFLHTKTIFIFSLFFFYKVSTAMVWLFIIPFFLYVKFSYIEIAIIVQICGFIAANIGHFIMYFLVERFNFSLILWLFSFLQPLVIFLFIIQHKLGHSVNFAYYVVLAFFFVQECVSSIKFIYISRLSKSFKDVHFYNAFFHSLLMVGQIFFSIIAGFIIDKLGWDILFNISIMLGIIPIVLLFIIYNKKIDIYHI